MRKIKLFTIHLRMILVIAALILPLSAQAQSNDNNAPSASEVSTRVFLPLISAGTGAQVEEIVNSDDLIRSLNEKYAGTGISFFVFDETDGNILRASRKNTGMAFTAERDKLIKFTNEDDLFAFVNRANPLYSLPNRDVNVL